MYKKVIMLVFTILMLFFPVFIFAQDEMSKAMNLADPSPEGIYKLGNTTIKFIPPEGWKMLNQDSSSTEYVGIQFMPPEFTMTSLRISTLPFPAVPGMSATALLENMLKDEASKDAGVSEQKMIKFANTDAATWIRKMGGMKTKQIQFFKGARMFMITFGAEEQDFNKLMSVIEESLKSFEIINQN